jgi:hypothetical protein
MQNPADTPWLGMGVMRLEKDRAERRAQGERDEARDHRRGGDRGCELREEQARDTGLRTPRVPLDRSLAETPAACAGNEPVRRSRVVAAVWRDPEDIGRDAVLRRSPKEIKGFKTPTIPLTAYSTATPSLLAGGVVEVCVPP